MNDVAVGGRGVVACCSSERLLLLLSRVEAANVSDSRDVAGETPFETYEPLFRC